MTAESEPAVPPGFDPESLEREPDEATRRLMLDNVLAFAELDGAIAMLSSVAFGLDATAGSIIFSKARSSDRLLKVIKLCEAHGHAQEGKQLRVLRQSLEHVSRPRNLICHAKFVGRPPDDHSRLLFAVYESGRVGHLTISALRPEEIAEATSWAKEASANLLSIVGRAGHLNDRPPPPEAKDRQA